MHFKKVLLPLRSFTDILQKTAETKQTYEDHRVQGALRIWQSLWRWFWGTLSLLSPQIAGILLTVTFPLLLHLWISTFADFVSGKQWTCCIWCHSCVSGTDPAVCAACRAHTEYHMHLSQPGLYSVLTRISRGDATGVLPASGHKCRDLHTEKYWGRSG